MKQNKVFKDTIYIFLGTSIGFVFSYLFRLFLAKNVTVAEFGLFYSIFTFVTFFLFFIYMGLDQSSIFLIVKGRLKKDVDRVKTVIVMTLVYQLVSVIIFIIFIFLFSNLLEIHFFKSSGSGTLLRLFSF